jgi:hypothetical protein
MATTEDKVYKTWLPSDTEDTSNPSYYKSLPKGVEVYEIIETVVNRDLGFTRHISYSDLGHIIRYTLRLGAKNGSLQELKKVRWYLERIIEREEQLEQEQKTNDPISKAATGSYRGSDFGFYGSEED